MMEWMSKIHNKEKVVSYLIITTAAVHFILLLLVVNRIYFFVKTIFSSVEMVTVVNSPRSPNPDATKEVETETDYLKIAKKGGGHKGLNVKIII